MLAGKSSFCRIIRTKSNLENEIQEYTVITTLSTKNLRIFYSTHSYSQSYCHKYDIFGPQFPLGHLSTS